MALSFNSILMGVFLFAVFFKTCDAIKCFECNSANNSACLYMHMTRMNAIVPVVDCSVVLPGDKGKDAFCRKITQTILDGDKAPDFRITRTCGWMKHKKDCYKANNMDHLETVCQCFDDLCNAATSLQHVKVTSLTAIVAITTTLQTWLKGF